MARSSPALAVAVATLAVFAALAPARAQFGSIFSPPRPPADVPSGGLSSPNFPTSRDRAPVEPLPAPMNLPPTQRPGVGPIQSQPLAPPPGGLGAPPAAPAAPLRGATQPPARETPNQGATQSPPAQALPGLAPGQRQPRGAPQQPAANEAPPPPNDEVMVEPPEQKLINPTAVFSGLDKITGRTISFDVAINETVQFGALQVTPRVCYSRPPTETPRTDAFVAVDEVTLQGEARRIFTGWMFAASPGLHAVEHPIYDVWLTDCKGATPAVTAEAPAEPSAEKPKPAAPPARKRSTAQPRSPSFLNPFR
jgi:hypothetical protein